MALELRGNNARAIGALCCSLRPGIRSGGGRENKKRGARDRIRSCVGPGAVTSAASAAPPSLKRRVRNERDRTYRAPSHPPRGNKAIRGIGESFLPFRSHKMHAFTMKYDRKSKEEGVKSTEDLDYRSHF